MSHNPTRPSFSAVSSPTRQEYIARCNRVVDYVEAHLGEPLSLEVLANVAGFSQFHFHCVFAAIVGETLSDFVARARVEKAATLLIQNLSSSVTEIALACGYASSATFARAFRQACGTSASEWRAGGYQRWLKQVGRSPGSSAEGSESVSDNQVAPDQPELSQHATGLVGADDNDCKQRKTPRKNWQETTRELGYSESGSIAGIDWLNSSLVTAGSAEGRTEMTQVKTTQFVVQDLPEMHVAYVRHTGPYANNGALFEDLFGRLMRWAGPRGLLGRPDMKMLAVYHDNPEITAPDKLRVSVCVTVPAGTPVSGEVGEMTISSGQYALARFELNPGEYSAAWDYLFRVSLPESDYQPDDAPCFEIYLNDPWTHPEHKQVVDICLKVKPL